MCAQLCDIENRGALTVFCYQLSDKHRHQVAVEEDDKNKTGISREVNKSGFNASFIVHIFIYEIVLWNYNPIKDDDSDNEHVFRIADAYLHYHAYRRLDYLAARSACDIFPDI